MGTISYPNESSKYRAARDDLLKSEIELRAHIEQVAAQRRKLPPGGALKEDYEFVELVDGEKQRTRLTELFDGHDALFLYSFMYSSDMDAACPMCTALIDGLNGQAIHLAQRISFALVAKHEIEEIHGYAEERSWSQLRLLSSSGNTYNADYHGEQDGDQRSNANVFVRDSDGIRHFWGAELSFEPMMEGGNMRHLDLIWPLWSVLDMTPGGRGQWYPQLSYDAE